MVEKEYNKLAQSYLEQGGMLPGNKKHAAYFVKVLFTSEHQETFLRFNANAVPQVIVSTSKMPYYKGMEFDEYIKRF